MQKAAGGSPATKGDHSLELQLYAYVYVYPPFRPEASNVVTGSGYVYKNRVDTPIAQFGLIFSPLIAEPSSH